MGEHGQVIGDASTLPARRIRMAAFAGSVLLYAVLQLGALGHPLLWQDEGETAMFGRRILDYGVPKVHGAEGVVYGMGVPLEHATDSERDVYLGSLWGQYYWAALGVAWSDGVDDPHQRTARVRLPFALLGMAGLAALLLAVRGALGARSGSALAAATAFVLLLCASTSLQLHLREVRYYGPMVGLVGLAVAGARALGGRSHRPARAGLLTAGLALVLTLLTSVFYPAAVAVMAWIAIESVLSWRRERRETDARRTTDAQLRWVSLGIATAAAFFLALRFDVWTLSRILSERWDFGPALYATNLGHLAVFLLRFELIGLVLLVEIALWLARRGARANEPARRAALSLVRLAALLAAIGAANPIFFERYFVAIGPLLALVLVLDGETLLARYTSGAADGSGLASPRFGLTLLALGLVGTAIVRQGELIGRVREIAVPVEGPVDRVVALLREEHAEPGQLLIATNYEAEPLMFYLGSRVVGRFHSGRKEAIRAERAERPDIVIPRSGHPERLGEVRRYLLDGGFVPRTLDVADTPYNSIPELYRGRVLDRTHWFATPEPGASDPPLILYERREVRDGPGR